MGGVTVGGAERRQISRPFLILVFFGIGFLTPDGTPTGNDQYLAGRAEIMRAHHGRADRFLKLGHREEHGNKAPNDEVVDTFFDITQAVWDGASRDDRKVVTNLLVIKDTLTRRIDPALTEDFTGVLADGMPAGEGCHDFLGGGDVVLGEVLGVRSRVGERLMVLVETLRGGEGRLGRETKAAVTFALQGGQIQQARGAFFLGLTLITDFTDAKLLRFCSDLAPRGFFKETFRIFTIGDARDLGDAAILASSDVKISLNFPKGLRDETADLELAFNDEHERRRLHPTSGIGLAT